MGAKSGHVHLDPKKIDAKLDAERVRIVALLRRLADRLEAAPPARISEGIAWVTAGVEMLVRSVERALGADRRS